MVSTNTPTYYKYGSEAADKRMYDSFRQRNFNLLKVLRDLEKLFNCDKAALDDICDQIHNTNEKYYYLEPKNKTFDLEWGINGGSISTDIFSTGHFNKNLTSRETLTVYVEKRVIQKTTISYIRKVQSSSKHKVYFSFELSYNKDLEIDYYQESYFDTNGKIHKNIILKSQLSNDELFNHLRFKLNMSAELHDLLPEILIPSAYDFNSDDYKSRFSIAEMMLF